MFFKIRVLMLDFFCRHHYGRWRCAGGVCLVPLSGRLRVSILQQAGEDFVNAVGFALNGIVFITRCDLTQKQPPGDEFQKKMGTERSPLVVERLEEEESAATWPSFGRLLLDLLKFAVEALGAGLLSFIPLNLGAWRSPEGLRPLRDRLIMPEDDPPEPPLSRRQTAPETMRQSPDESSGAFATPRPQKLVGKPSATLKDPPLPDKHRKRPELGEFYGPGASGESKLQKERARHRHRGAAAAAAYADPNPRSKFRANDGFPF